MATRPIVQHQKRGEAGVVGKQTNMAAAEGRNRRALGDIGNVVTVRGPTGKPLPQISRPVTRSFCAQLLANAQAAAAENNKKAGAANVNVAIVGDGVLPGKGNKGIAAPKPNNVKKINPKQKPVTVIEISPDSVEESKKDEQSSRKKESRSSSRKISQSLTSTLTARSKAACGLANKPKKEIFDIDSLDIDNELAVVEYVEDIYNFYKLAENESRVHDYMHTQPEINEKMRAILIDWLVEVHNKFELMPETLYLTINIVDRYLEKKIVARRELQLVGISAMLMASKYEEIWAPEVNDFVCISDRAYTHEQVLVMEKNILGELEWNLTVPTPYVFLVRFIKAASADSAVEHMVHYLAELGVMNYATIRYCPSLLAASAVYVARTTINNGVPFWNDTLQLHTGYSESQLRECAELLLGIHSSASENKLKVIYKKYSSTQRDSVATLVMQRNINKDQQLL